MLKTLGLPIIEINHCLEGKLISMKLADQVVEGLSKHHFQEVDGSILCTNITVGTISSNNIDWLVKQVLLLQVFVDGSSNNLPMA